MAKDSEQMLKAICMELREIRKVLATLNKNYVTVNENLMTIKKSEDEEARVNQLLQEYYELKEKKTNG